MGDGEVPFTIEDKAPINYTLKWFTNHKTGFFLSSWQKKSFNSNYNRQTISLFSLWFEEWPENSRGNDYIISTFLDLSKKTKQEKSL